jgi:signal transduction histidine kinase
MPLSTFRRLPIQRKLMAMILTVSAVVLVLSGVGYVASNYYQARKELQSDLLSQADLILKNADAALDFRDAATARQTLATLAPLTNIRFACLYDARGAFFADYRSPDAIDSCPPTAPTDGATIGSNRLVVARTGFLQGKKFGSVLIHSSLEALTNRQRIQLSIVVVLFVAAVAVAIVLSSRMQAIVSDPILSLARTAGEVTTRADYSLRATRTTDDELGVLVDAFNRMLERIEIREAELSRANDELRKEIAERRRAEQERAELLVREREANRLKDEFLATLSHELRTPLNAILGWTKLLRSNAVPAVAVDRALEKVERNALVQSRLIEDLLEISRIVSGKLRLDYRPFDLVTLCSAAIDALRPTAEARGVALHRDVESVTMPTAGDPDRLQQVIWNLVSNAVKFTPSGGKVTVTLRRTGPMDEIAVVDTGIGIDPAFLPNVFETFRQADASSTRTHGGLGLGLSIVKQLVDLHGGEVHASSAGKGQGATFVVRLPVRTAELRRVDDPLPVPPQSLVGRLEGRDILVVDDDADTRELLVSVLENAGGRVRAAASAEEALTMAVAHVPEAVVSDIAMPGQDGYVFMQQLRDALGARIPRVRVALSAFAAPRDRERALSAGFQRHVAKPVDPVTLVGVLDDMLANQLA